MSLLSLILVIVAIGVILWLVTTYIPMDANIKRVLVAVVVIVLVVWLLQVFGLLDRLGSVRVR
jgi:hypothetical protein